MLKENGAPRSAGYQLFMLALCIFALLQLAFQTAVEVDPRTLSILEYADLVICFLFFLDFWISLYNATNPWKYFITWGWIDLLSAMPALEMARWGRLGRVLRIVRIFRGIRATKILAALALERRAENAGLAAGLLALLLMVVCSVMVLHFENVENANIRTADDALWWAFATVTTVGYGDRYPVTGEGRLIAGILMCTGVGLFGTLSGLLATWFLMPEGAHQDKELAALKKEVQALRVAVERLAGEGERQSEQP